MLGICRLPPSLLCPVFPAPLCWDPPMKTFILGISTGLFLNKYASHLPPRKLWTELIPHSPPDLCTCVKTCQRPSCELPLVSGADTPDRGNKPSSFLCSLSHLQGPLRRSSLPLVSLETQGPLLRSSLALAFRDAPELPAGLLPEVLSSQGIFFWTSAAESCKLQFQQTKRTSSYSSNTRSRVAPAVSISSCAKAEDHQVSTELLTLQGLH